MLGYLFKNLLLFAELTLQKWVLVLDYLRASEDYNFQDRPSLRERQGPGFTRSYVYVSFCTGQTLVSRLVVPTFWSFSSVSQTLSKIGCQVAGQFIGGVVHVSCDAGHSLIQASRVHATGHTCTSPLRFSNTPSCSPVSSVVLVPVSCGILNGTAQVDFEVL